MVNTNKNAPSTLGSLFYWSNYMRGTKWGTKSPDSTCLQEQE